MELIRNEKVPFFILLRIVGWYTPTKRNFAYIQRQERCSNKSSFFFVDNRKEKVTRKLYKEGSYKALTFDLP